MRRFRCILFLATSAGCGLGCNSSQPISSPVVADTEHQAVTQPEPEPAPTVAEVTELLERGHRHCGVGPVVPHPLERIGEKAFPALEAILANPKTESRPIGNTLDAFDVWLKSEAYRKHELGDELLLRVKLQRDSLQKRLDDQPKKLLDGK